MNKIMLLGISILILIIIFIIIVIIIGKKKINEIITQLDISQDEINKNLKEKYKLYKEIIKFIKNNLSIKEDAFSKFINLKLTECPQDELFKLLDNTIYEINEYVDNYEDLLKNKDFLKLKKELYTTQISLESAIDYYNKKVDFYNNNIHNGPTKICKLFFKFDEYSKVNTEIKEITRLINFN